MSDKWDLKQQPQSLREPGMHPVFALGDEGSRMLAVTAVGAERLSAMLADRPALAVMAPEEVLTLLCAPTSWVSYESALERVALSMLLVRAVERRDMADPHTGDAA